MTFASDADASLRKDLALAARQWALARIAPGLIHELRGPLNAIHLNVELLKAQAGTVEGESGDNLQRYVGVVEEELQRFQKRFEHFFARAFPAGREELEEIDLRETVEEVEDLVRVQARKERVSLDLELPREPVWVEGVVGDLRDALLQMAVFALDRAAAADGGSLRMTLRRNGRTVRLTLAGAGPVGDFDDLAVQVARSLWEEQGGRVSTPSLEGNGCEIYMDLPLRESHEKDE